MIKSMTGQGNSEHSYSWGKVTCEIKTLNSKYFDLSLRLPSMMSSYEMEIRDIISKSLVRGKVMTTLEVELTSVNNDLLINEALFRAYFNRFKTLHEDLDSPPSDIFRQALSSPDVLKPPTEARLDAGQWHDIRSCIENAMQKCNQFRSDEGGRLSQSFEENIGKIRRYLKKVEELDPKRIENLSQKIRTNLEEIKVEADPSRFEQEMVFYLDRLDIKEEKVRLNSHLDYFIETMNGSESNGKKLSFITQEMGREINTMGSKAYDAEIQKVVVSMKEELEKIKEQVLNIL